MRLVSLGLSWIAGICLGMWAGLHWGMVAAIGVAALVALLLRRRKALLLLFCLAALLGGIVRFESTVIEVDDLSLRSYNGSGTVLVKGLVVGDPETSGGRVALDLEASEVEVAGQRIEVSGRALVYAPAFPHSVYLEGVEPRALPYYRYGDVVLVEGELENPPELEGFDWPDYLARRGVYSVIMHPGRIELLDSGQGCRLRELLYDLRQRMSGSLSSAVAEPQASVANAVFLGKRSGIPDELNDALSRTGTAHVVAISGLHIGIVGGIALALAAWVFGRRRPTYLILALVAVWGYASLTGLNPPAVRAGIMITMWLLADWIGRPRSALPALVFAAAVMVGITPSILREASFQMSFAAMSGLILVTPHLQALGRRVCRVGDEERTLRGLAIDGLSVTLGVMVTTMPVIAYHFHYISLVAPLANLVVVPALPGAIGTAALTATAGLFAPPLAVGLGWLAWLFTGYMVTLIEFFAGLPFAALEFEIGAPFVWVYYAALGAFLWAAGRGAKVEAAFGWVGDRLRGARGYLARAPLALVVLPLVAAAALTWTAAASAPDGRLHVYFLDVGQGDAILVQIGRQQVLIDGGPDAEAISLRLGEEMPFWDRTIELVVATHPDADHITGLVEVVRRYEVEMVVVGEQEGESLVSDEWQRALEQEDIECAYARAGQRIVLSEDVVMDVLHPQEDLLRGTASDTNNNSVVIRLVCGDFSLLLTGDVFEEAEGCLLDGRFGLRSTVLKVAHHGSGGSTCPEFLSAVDPQVAVISVGADNTFGHPDPEVTERLSQAVGDDALYLTSEHGTIELITDGERLWVKTGR